MPRPNRNENIKININRIILEYAKLAAKLLLKPFLRVIAAINVPRKDEKTPTITPREQYSKTKYFLKYL